MQYLSWSNHSIPLCFVTGISYSKRARIVEHRGGFVHSRGFETSEINAQIQVSRAACMAYDLNFDKELLNVRNLFADKRNTSGGVTIGGYNIYPELQFALTNINTTITSDITKGISVYACDITLSGVSCTKEVNRLRVLEFEPEQDLPTVSLKCNGRKLVIQDGCQISGLIITPLSCDLECIIGDDSQKASRKGFIDDLIENGGEIELASGQNVTNYNIINASKQDNIIILSGSIYTESATQVITKTYQKVDISAIIDDILHMCGVKNTSIKVKGMVDYFVASGTPLEILKSLQESAGFVISARNNKVFAVQLPSKIDASKQIEGEIVDDTTREKIGGIIWRDGLHEYQKGGEDGEILKIDSCFSSESNEFCDNVLETMRYNSTLININTIPDPEIAHHTPVLVEFEGDSKACLVDWFQVDYINGIASYELKYKG